MDAKSCFLYAIFRRDLVIFGRIWLIYFWEFCMKKFFIGILVLVSFYIVLNASSNHIRLKIPDIAQNANRIPVGIIIDNGLKKGDLLIVKVDNKIAFELQTNGDEIMRINAHLRGLKSNTSNAKISAVLTRKDGTSEFISKNSVYLGSPSILRHGREGSKRVKFRVTNNKIKLVIKNQMGKNKYVQNLALSTSAGTIKIKMTPVVSRNPYFKIIGKKNFGKVKTKVSLSN